MLLGAGFVGGFNGFLCVQILPHKVFFFYVITIVVRLICCCCFSVVCTTRGCMLFVCVCIFALMRLSVNYISCFDIYVFTIFDWCFEAAR